MPRTPDGRYVTIDIPMLTEEELKGIQELFAAGRKEEAVKMFDEITGPRMRLEEEIRNLIRAGKVEEAYRLLDKYDE